MHEDYSSPKFSVTEMFKNSFESHLKDLNNIKFFLIGGNGGTTYTTNRFDIHKSEINELIKNHPGQIDLCFSTDARQSANEKYEWDTTNVFFSVVASSSYLWILHKSSIGNSLEVICVAGIELSNEMLAACYKENIVKLLQ
jgi:hypothetical protein